MLRIDFKYELIVVCISLSETWKQLSVHYCSVMDEFVFLEWTLSTFSLILLMCLIAI